VTESESMDIQESSIPELATSARLVRSSRTHFPPPKARSPMKTALGSSPRRQSSMGPRAQSANPPSSPIRAVSHPVVNRVLDFEQDEESSLQETPALSGSGMQRRKRTDIYDIEESPTGGQSEVLEESIIQEEIVATEDSVMLDMAAEESYVADLGNDATTGAEVEVSEAPEEEDEPEEVVAEPSKPPTKRGRKRKSEVMESPAEAMQDAPKARKRGAAAQTQAPEPHKKVQKAAATAPSRRSKRVSDIGIEESSTVLDDSVGASEPLDTPPVVPKRRGRPPMAKNQAEEPAPSKEKKKTKAKDPAGEPVPTKEKKTSKSREQAQGKEQDDDSQVFKKPKLMGRPKKKPEAKSNEKEPEVDDLEGGRLVDLHGKPVSKDEVDKMSTTSAGSRFGRGRHLSVFRELDPDAVARVGRTGRHRVAPVDFWKNEAVEYDEHGNMLALRKNALKEPVPKKQTGYKYKSRKKPLAALEEEEDEVELEPWEEEDSEFGGQFGGVVKSYDPATQSGGMDLIEDSMYTHSSAPLSILMITAVAWAPKGINPVAVGDGSFKYCKLASAGDDSSFMSWGFVELDPDQMKRTKNARRMHMCFHVQSGVVQVKVHENQFLVRRGGVWQVPRGK
jgi:centromere protein C